MTIKIRLEETSSEHYRGPKTQAKTALYVEDGGYACYVDIFAEEGFSSALVKAGVALHKARNPDFKIHQSEDEADTKIIT